MANAVHVVEQDIKKVLSQGNIVPAHIVTRKSMNTIPMVYVGNVAVAANARPVAEMATNKQAMIAKRTRAGTFADILGLGSRSLFLHIFLISTSV